MSDQDTLPAHVHPEVALLPGYVNGTLSGSDRDPKGIRVNAVAPGQIATQFHERFSTPVGRANTVKTIPLGREGTADEVAHAVAFLASPAASFVNGEVSGINGGMWFH